jgi:hypothetical protein
MATDNLGDDVILDEQRQAFLKILDGVTAQPHGLSHRDVARLVVERWRARFREVGDDDPDIFSVQSTVRLSTGEPLVTLSWGPLSGVLSIEEAQSKGLALLAACEGARTDAAIWGMFPEEGAKGKEMAAYLMHMLAVARGQAEQPVSDAPKQEK